MTAVSAGEKYAAVGTERPLCQCVHCKGLRPKRWQSDGELAAGGHWRCGDDARYHDPEKLEQKRKRDRERAWERYGDIFYREPRLLKQRHRRMLARRARLEAEGYVRDWAAFDAAGDRAFAQVLQGRSLLRPIDREDQSEQSSGQGEQPLITLEEPNVHIGGEPSVSGTRLRDEQG